MKTEEEIRVKRDCQGITRYYNKKGFLHRIDGPAIEYPNGTKRWYQNGLRHRLDGPATDHADGYKEWRQNGQLHRLDTKITNRSFAGTGNS
jgi:hypothetical protein